MAYVYVPPPRRIEPTKIPTGDAFTRFCLPGLSLPLNWVPHEEYTRYERDERTGPLIHIVTPAVSLTLISILDLCFVHC